MEYFRLVDKKTSEAEIQEKITPENIDLYSESMLFLTARNTYFEGATLWGEFQISYDKIKGGVRFTLLDCPNAFAWTITTGFSPERNKIVVHCTINRAQKNIQFIKEIQEFLDEWEQGLISSF